LDFNLKFGLYRILFLFSIKLREVSLNHFESIKKNDRYTAFKRKTKQKNISVT